MCIGHVPVLSGLCCDINFPNFSFTGFGGHPTVKILQEFLHKIFNGQNNVQFWYTHTRCVQICSKDLKNTELGDALGSFLQESL